MTTNEKLQQLFEAALQTLDEPISKPIPANRENMFPPPPWRTQEEVPPKPAVLPQERMEA